MVTARRVAAMVVLVVGVLAMNAAPASAEPPDTFGFNTQCDQIRDGIADAVPLPYLGDLVANGASAACKSLNVEAHPLDAAEAAIGKAWSSAFGQVVDTLMTALGQAIILSLAWWTKIPNDKMLDSGGLFNQISDYTYAIQVWLLVLSIVVSAARIGLARRHAAAEQAEEAFKALARATVATWVAGAGFLAATRLTDAFSDWIIDDATGGNAKGVAELMVNTSKFQVFSPGLMFVLAIVGILGALAMAVLALVRQGLMVVAVALFPLAAAASGTKGGMQSFQKLTGWLIAFVLFKPVAALVYMIAFTTAEVTNTGTQTAVPSGDQAQRQLVGVILLCSVAFVLPAIMRLVVPIVSAVGGGGGGAGATGGALMAGAAMLTGAKALAAKGAASPGGSGAAGYVGWGGGSHDGGGSAPPPPPPPPQGGPKGGGAGGGATTQPSGTRQGGGAARVSAAAGGAAAGISRAGDDVAGDSAGEAAWMNRAPNLGSHSIAR